jgi:hypothetical protein
MIAFFISSIDTGVSRLLFASDKRRTVIYFLIL